MEQNNEIRILLNEDKFSQICKVGFIRYQSATGASDIHFLKHDILLLASEEIVSKDLDDQIIKFMMVKLDKENIREIIKRSPIFYELSNQI